jgi:hypothetical protein
LTFFKLSGLEVVQKLEFRGWKSSTKLNILKTKPKLNIHFDQHFDQHKGENESNPDQSQLREANIIS